MIAQYRSARRFRNPSPLFRWAEARGLLVPRGRALVFGAGLLLEAERLAELGWEVDAVETTASIARRQDLYLAFAERSSCRVLDGTVSLADHYALATITHVLEFIEHPRQRRTLLSDITSKLDSEGVLLLSLRGLADVLAARHATPRGDGVVTALGTWTRGFSVAEAKELITAAGLVITGAPNPKSRTPEQVRVICRPSSNVAPP